MTESLNILLWIYVMTSSYIIRSLRTTQLCPVATSCVSIMIRSSRVALNLSHAFRCHYKITVGIKILYWIWVPGSLWNQWGSRDFVLDMPLGFHVIRAMKAPRFCSGSSTWVYYHDKIILGVKILSWIYHLRFTITIRSFWASKYCPESTSCVPFLWLDHWGHQNFVLKFIIGCMFNLLLDQYSFHKLVIFISTGFIPRSPGKQQMAWKEANYWYKDLQQSMNNYVYWPLRYYGYNVVIGIQNCIFKINLELNYSF